jgi:hypothetical protein
MYLLIIHQFSVLAVNVTVVVKYEVYDAKMQMSVPQSYNSN